VRLEKFTKSEPLAIKTIHFHFLSIHFLSILFLIFVSGLVTTACSTAYKGTALNAWDEMANSQIDTALSDYKKNVTSDKDKLLRLMDEGILLRVAKRYKESNQKFLKASDIIEMAGYIDAGEQAVTLVTNEKQTVYQGEDFEKVLIHMYLALNYISFEQWEDALVEARKVNEVLYLMISEAKRPYKLDAFARYLDALIYDKSGETNDAFIDYKNTLKIDPSLAKRFPVLQEDLLRTAGLLHFQDQFQSYAKQFGNKIVEATQKAIQNRMAQLVLIFQSGKSPEKYSSKERRSKEGKGGHLIEIVVPIAYYASRHTNIRWARMTVGHQSVRTVTLSNIDKTVRHHLQDRMGRVIAKALLTAGVKAGIATGVGVATHNRDLGILAGLALFAMSDADTRSWLLLPHRLQMAKVYLNPGDYDVKLQYLNHQGNVVGDETTRVSLHPEEVKIIQRRKFR